jgi:hypothetical protein
MNIAITWRKFPVTDTVARHGTHSGSVCVCVCIYIYIYIFLQESNCGDDVLLGPIK